MARYELGCVWEMYGTLVVEADSLEEAITYAIDVAGLPQGEYIDDSFSIDNEMLDECNPNHEAEVKAYLKAHEHDNNDV